MSKEHTPTPWRIAGKGTIRAGDGWIGTLNWRNRDANAEFLVRAVNSHEDLVEALKGCRGLVRALTGADDDIANAAIREADAAIAKAEGAK